MVTQRVWECLIDKEPLTLLEKTSVALSPNLGRLGLAGSQHLRVFESQQIPWLTHEGEGTESSLSVWWSFHVPMLGSTKLLAGDPATPKCLVCCGTCMFGQL